MTRSRSDSKVSSLSSQQTGPDKSPARVQRVRGKLDRDFDEKARCIMVTRKVRVRRTDG